MVYNIGRFLQLMGMLILPIAIAGNAANSLTLGQMLTWTSVGIGVFAFGWIVQQKGKP